MNLLCRGIADWCKRNGAVSEEDYPIILYGIQVCLNTSLKLLGILLIGALLHQLAAVLVSMAVFCSMRYWTGGWHSKSHLGCFCTMLIPCVCPSLLMGINGEWTPWEWTPWEWIPIVSGCMLVYSIYRILRYAPCNSEVNPIEDVGILRVKRLGSIAELVVLSIAVIFLGNGGVGSLVLIPLCVDAALLKA